MANALSVPLAKSKALSGRSILLQVIMGIVTLLYIYPILNMVFLSLKEMSEIYENPLWIPVNATLENYRVAWETMGYPRAFLNSLSITLVSIALIVLVSSMAAYPIARYNLRFTRIMYVVFVSIIMVPGQMTLIPIVRMFYSIGLVNTRLAMIVYYLSAEASFAIFLYAGFIRTIPRELEEAAIIDGCGPFAAFSRVVLPLLKPVTATVIILNIMLIWNDFLMPLVLVQSDRVRPLMPTISQFFEEFISRWNYAFAGSVMVVIPGLIAFLALQKQFVSGIAAGAIK